MTESLPATDHSDLAHTNHCDAFAFSEREQLALDLYNELRELELQESLLRAQAEGADMSDMAGLSDVREHLIKAEREAMEAQVEYELRNRITRNVLAMDPVLKAVYGSDRSGHDEKRLLPLIAENDVVSMLHGHLTSKLVSAREALDKAEQGNAAANEKNRELSRTLLALVKKLEVQSSEDIEQPQLREKISAVDKEVKEARRRMRNLKGILSGMIVGSGIDWAEDEVLRELVMDDEDDG